MTVRLPALAAIALVTSLGATPSRPGVGRDPVEARTVAIGRSVSGRPIIAIERGDPDNPKKALVVGCIHGNERAGIAIAKYLLRSELPAETDLWIVPSLNPDGAARRIRGNARGVDLNRNFPFRWRRLGGAFYSGPRPLSEPESRSAYRLIRRLRPAVSIWFHQHLDLVDASGGDLRVERRFASLAGLRLFRLAPRPGAATRSENHELPGTTAFVVELPAGALAPAAVRRLGLATIAVTAGG